MLTSIFFYLLIYISSFCTAYCYSKTKDKSAAVVFLLLTFMILFLPEALRYGPGTDYKNYYRIISKAIARKKYDRFEPGWTPVLWFMGQFNIDIQWWFVVTTFFTIFFMFLSVEKEDFWMAVPLFASLAYIESYNTTRQILASAICMYAIRLWLRRKHIWSILFILLGYSFHKSAILFLFIVPFMNQDWKIFGKYKNLFLFFIIIFLVMNMNMASIFAEKFASKTFYAHYLRSEKATMKAITNTGLGVLSSFLAILLVLLFTTREKPIYVQKNVAEKNQLYQATIILALFYFFFQMLGLQIKIIGRVAYLFSISYIYLVPAIYHSKSKYRKLIVYVILGLRTFYLIGMFLQNAHAILPYTSILNKY